MRPPQGRAVTRYGTKMACHPKLHLVSSMDMLRRVKRRMVGQKDAIPRLPTVEPKGDGGPGTLNLMLSKCFWSWKATLLVSGQARQGGTCSFCFFSQTRKPRNSESRRSYLWSYGMTLIVSAPSNGVPSEREPVTSSSISSPDTTPACTASLSNLTIKSGMPSPS